MLIQIIVNDSKDQKIMISHHSSALLNVFVSNMTMNSLDIKLNSIKMSL